MLRKKGIALRVRDMLQASSISEMAGAVVVDAASSRDDDTAVALNQALSGLDCRARIEEAAIDIDDVESILPATPMQVHMISTWQNSGGLVFFPEFRYRLRGQFGLAAVRSAWKELVGQTPILRTTFLATGSKTLPFIQLIMKSTHAEMKPLMVVSLEEEDGQASYIVSVKIHHALYDGVSLPIIMDAFARLCGGGEGRERNSRPPNLENLPGITGLGRG